MMHIAPPSYSTKQPGKNFGGKLVALRLQSASLLRVCIILTDGGICRIEHCRGNMMSRTDRRTLLGVLGAGIAMSGVPGTAFVSRKQDTHVPIIFEPRTFGAKGDGKALDSAAINAAISACTQAGGGIVYLSPGTYRCGTVMLKSNVTLYLEAGATILGSVELNDYTREPGPPLMKDTGQLHLIFAKDAVNVTLCGAGRIDGQGRLYWRPAGHPPLPPQNAWAGVLSVGWTKGRLPSPMLEFVNCKWLRIEDIRIEDAPGWTMRPINCEQVFIRGISIKNPTYGPNTDGMDITGCTNVFVSDCSIDTGDDAICVKSENPYGSDPLVTKNIVVTNCVLTTCCNGFKLGTASQGGFENITFSNSVIYNNAVSFPERVISGIALEVVDGGWIEGVIVTGIRMQRTRTPIFIRLGDRSKKQAYPQHGLRGVMIEDIHASESLLASSITGLENALVEDVTLSNIRIDNVLPSRPEWVNQRVPEVPRQYPEARMFGMLPVSGIYCRHVRGLRLMDLSFRVAAGEQRPLMLCDDVRDIRISGLSTTSTKGQEPVIKLVQSGNAWISGAAAPAETATFLTAEGADCSNILLSDCDLRGAAQVVELGEGVAPQAVTVSGTVLKRAGAKDVRSEPLP